MTKKDVYKLKPGTWLKVTYLDSEPDVALLVEKVVRGRGDVSLKLFARLDRLEKFIGVH